MSLTLHLSDPTGAATSAAPPLTLERGKATIGRGSANDLVLLDPQGVISKFASSTNVRRHSGRVPRILGAGRAQGEEV